MRALHDRMPVLLPNEAEREAWLELDTPRADLEALFRPAADGLLRHHPVDRRVGSPRFNDASCILPLPMPERSAAAGGDVSSRERLP
jgi:putative SOS response-associated peptidase YedK